MAIDFTHFKLYDTDILDLLWSNCPDNFLVSRSEPEDSEGVFDALQERDLIYSITQLNYSRVYSLLRKLDHPLSPTDAMAACLCALNGTSKLMNTLLDHCPPLPEFQFQGVGKVSSLLNSAVEYDKRAMVDILLRRGADPNGSSCDGKVPVEVAFCNHAYGSLKRLLEIPGIEIPLTDDMLYAWGALTTGDTGGIYFNPCSLWCCQLLLEKLTALGCKNIILTGVSYVASKTGIVVFENGQYHYYEHELLPNSCHGTGDIYASAFVGAFVRGKSAYDAAAIAANYTMDCIRCTAQLDNHWYGAAFEPVLGKLIDALK
jgi:hypothetical protein